MASNKSRNQKGYILLSVMLLMILMLIALTIELPRISQQIKRDKEEELIHRAGEYTRAIRKFYRKFGRYPLSIEQLENTNNMRFLRKRFKDPMTGKDDWRIIHQGEAILKIPGSGAAVNVNGQQGGGSFGAPIAGTNPGSNSTQPAGGTQNSQSPGGTSTDSPGNSNSTASSGSTGSAFGNPQPGGGPMIGVASSKKAVSIKIINEKDHYNEWEFVYDPRLEQQQLGGGMNTPNNPNAGSVVGSGTNNPNNLNNPNPTGSPRPPQ
jgi:type II secretory pathway pseudopilin PulG